MELITLKSDFQPNKLVENYSSLIWTERYSACGDFEYKTNDIERALQLMPLESMVSLRESTVPMLVEVYKLENPKNQAPVLTITGRSVECALERRAATVTPFGSTKAPWTISAAKPSDAAYLAMRKILGDVARFQNGVEVLSAINPTMSLLDALPGVDLTLPADYYIPPEWNSATAYVAGNQVTNAGKIWQARIDNTNVSPTTGVTWMELTYEIDPGNLYSAVMNQLAINYRGLKAVRPGIGESDIGLEIYNGADRRGTVTLDARFDQFDESTYLFSSQGSTNVAYVYKNGASQSVDKTTTEPSGWDRRVLYVDAASENPTDLRSKGLVELYKYNVTAIFDGQIAAHIALGYNKKFFLGDIIKLTGEYGLHRDVRISEFIRTSDATGDKAYPALEVIES